METTSSAPQDELAIIIDSPETLQYALLWSPWARRKQVETVDQLWRSVRDLTLFLGIHHLLTEDTIDRRFVKT
jgi:hypothetical protein